jgi:hypothetical protein
VSFGGTGFLFWGRLGSRASTEKKIGADYEPLVRAVYLCFHSQKIDLKFFQKCCSICTKMLHSIKVKNVFKNFESILFWVEIG